MAGPSLQQQFFEMLMVSQYWPEAQLRDYQRSQMGQFLKHARAHVPFYKTRLDPIFRPDGEIDWDRWGEVPILKRAELAEHGEALKADELPKGHGGKSVSTTSGTSGRPIAVTSSQLAHMALRANRFRSYKWHGADWGKKSVSVFGEDAAEAPWPNGEVVGPWGPAWDPETPNGAIIKINRFTDYDKIVEFIGRHRPQSLATGPKTGLAIALEAERIGAHIHFDVFLTQGAMVGELERATMRRVFGARIAELYSSKEGGQIAHGCPDQPGLHVNAESILVEIVDEAGRPCGVGEPGRIILTPFFNSAQPLIRYEQGDVGEWMEPCPCGRHLPRLGNLIGRSTGLFYHPDGRVRAGFLHPDDRAILKCSAWQIAQTGPHRFEVRYVPLDWDVPGDEAEMEGRIKRIYFADAEVGFTRVREIASSRGGKHVEYVNEWLPPGQTK
ncbi:MAG: hypothetical protein ABL866_04560 [Devosia sp.]